VEADAGTKTCFGAAPDRSRISPRERKAETDMGNTLAILIGAVCIVLGIILLAVWWPAFLAVLQGCLGITLLCGGLLALAIGISEMRAAKEFESAVPPATSGEDEALSESAELTEESSEESAESTEESDEEKDSS
jgi:hypothetical protein